MSDSTQNIDLIERYFDNDMTADEKIMFYEQLKSNLELKHLFDREKLLINTVRFGAAKNHLHFFKELEKSLPDVSVEKKNSGWVYYAAAASVAILLVTGIYFFRTNGSAPSELYAEYFTPFPNRFEPTVRGSEKLTKRALAFQKYEEGDYQRAAGLFSEILVDGREPAILLLLGNANLAIGNTAEAKNNFDEAMKTSADLAPAAQWYLSLSYLREGDEEHAIEILKTLSAGTTPYGQKAQDILTRLTH